MEIPARPKMPARLALLPALAFLLWSCGATQPEDPSSAAAEWVAEGPMIPVTLPGGAVIQAELRQTLRELQTGMMFRPQLPPDNGMLFVFDTLEPRAFWMYRTLHPLDIVWLDENKRIVEIQENAPPCESLDARDCPTYGGVASSLYSLEMAAGQVIRRGLKVGDQLQF
jgi:uncharacterized membrane protein (UPF0127 family)